MANVGRLRSTENDPSGLVALMYVSVSLIELRVAGFEVAKIVGRSIEKNAEMDLTGVLISTGAHFAQVLEGDADLVDRLMAVIMVDPRHRGVTIVERCPIAARRFAEWSLAYMGGATYVDRPIQRLLARDGEGAKREQVDEIYAMMDEFTRA